MGAAMSSSEQSNTEAGARRIRVLVGKAGLDGHDRGIKVVARILRDAGMEVVYTGLHRTPEQIVNTALQEDVEPLREMGVAEIFSQEADPDFIVRRVRQLAAARAPE